MNLNDLFLQGCISLLGGYVALSGYLASSLQETLVSLNLLTPPAPIAVAVPTKKEEVPPEVVPTKLPSHYEIGGPIPRILLENIEYQQAAVAGAGSSREEKRIAANVSDALVNIFCTYREGDRIRATTGSGVFIDSRGVILTNAHVAQFLLLTESRTDATCTIRQGDPAVEKYTADLLYISPAWVLENAKLVDDAAPTGTGERDYALLYVTGAIESDRPDEFPALAFNTTLLKHDVVGNKVLAAGYPAEIFKTEGPRAHLVPKVATTTVTELFTFGSKEADLMAISDSAVGEQGVSGGPVLHTNGTIMGLIVTRGNAEKNGTRSLRALTIPYINQTILEETGFDLRTTLEGNIARRSGIFKKALASFLSSLLERELSHNTP